MSGTTRVAVEVLAGVVPTKPMPEHTRIYTISSDEWAEAGEKQGELLAELNGKAQGYAGLLMLQPDHLNWVQTTWLWF